MTRARGQPKRQFRFLPRKNKRVVKKPHKPYHDTMDFTETREVLLFNNQTYRFSVYITLNASRMRSMIGVFETHRGRNLITADVLDPARQESNRQRYMPEFQSASETKLKLSGTITTHLPMGEGSLPEW